MLRIVSVGDIMPGGILSITGTKFVTTEVMELMSYGDIRVGNLECAIDIAHPSGKKFEAGGNTIFIKEKDAFRIKELGIDIVSIANNHLFDLGPDGAYKAIETLDRLGIKHCGAGSNIFEAQKPVVITHDGETYAFIAFSDTRLKFMYEATETEPGVNPLHEDYVVNEIKKNKQLYNNVIVIPHWGIESTYFPTLEVVDLANKMVRAGASLVLGGHTHKIQPVLNSHRSSIVYSMGNFLFSNRIINTPKYTYYPDTPLDLERLPTVIGCPEVQLPTIKLWKPISYVGMIVFSSVGHNKAFSEYKLTHMDMNNCVDVLRSGVYKQRFILSSLGFIIKTGLYGLLVGVGKFYLIVRKGVKRI